MRVKPLRLLLVTTYRYTAPARSHSIHYLQLWYTTCTKYHLTMDRIVLGGEITDQDFICVSSQVYNLVLTFSNLIIIPPLEYRDSQHDNAAVIDIFICIYLFFFSVPLYCLPLRRWCKWIIIEFLSIIYLRRISPYILFYVIYVCIF